MAVYIGLMPSAPSAHSSNGIPRIDAPTLLAAELGPMLVHEPAAHRLDLGRALARIPRRFMHADTVVANLVRLLE